MDIWKLKAGLSIHPLPLPLELKTEEEEIRENGESVAS
jgi:hypothetical protein